MATINYDFYNGNDLYDDGKIEKSLLEHYKCKKSINEDSEEYFYLTTPIRENILKWYPFSKTDSVLEIGGGVGTLTGCLCQKCKEVYSIENSKRRSEILYYRNKEYDNLNVIVANVQDVKIEKKFDYIVLIGVFEYTKKFYNCNSQKCFEQFLTDLKKFLTKNGKILIAIENRYGIKYFAGKNEDHYSKQYVGIEGYKDLDIQTFGLEELKTIFKTCNLSNYKFYYPFPDYKLPMVIYTDNHLPSQMEALNLPMYNYDQNTYNFNQNLVMKDIIKNNNFAFFANSFLVEIGSSESKLSNIEFVKFQPDRNKKYNVITTIDNKAVYKYFYDVNDSKHLENLLQTHKKLNKIGFLAANIDFKKDKFKIEKIDGITLIEKMLTLYYANEFEQFYMEIKNALEYIKTFTEFKKNINPFSLKIKMKVGEVLKIGLLDLNFNNILINRKGNYVIIDQEWATKKDVPYKYVVYFCIKMLYELIPDLEKVISSKIFFDEYAITLKDIKEYNAASLDYFDKQINFRNLKLYTHLLNRSSIVKNNEKPLEFEILFKDQQQKNLELIAEYKKVVELLDETNKKLIEMGNQYRKNEDFCKELQKQNINLINETKTLEKELQSKAYKLILKIRKLKHKLLGK